MKQQKFAIWFLSPIVLFALVGAFATIMTSFNHNEHMYIAASILFAQGQTLYQDFAYLQMPYLPLLYGTLFRLLGINSLYLFTGKLISFLFLGISSTIVFLVARRVLDRTDISLGFATLFLLNITIVYTAVEVSNYIMPVAFSLLGFYVYVASIENEIRPFGIAVAGFFLAIAIGTKLTYAPLVVPFVATSLFCPLSEHLATISARRRIAYVLFPLIAGIAIGLFPICFFLLDFKSFLFNNLGYHSINTQWRQITGSAYPMSLHSKLAYAYRLFFKTDNLVVLFGIVLGLGFSIRRAQPIRWIPRQIPIGASLAFLLVLIAVPTALAPTPSFHQYFAMPVSLLFLLLVYSVAANSGAVLALYGRVLLILVLVSVVFSGPLLLRRISNLTHRDRWSGLHIRDVSVNVRDILIDRTAGANYRIATLSPLFVLESNLPIYSELSTGPFLYRVGDLLTPEDRSHLVGTSPQSIASLLSEEEPAAILVGFEGELDIPLVEYAIANSYVEIDVAQFGGELYVRP